MADRPKRALWHPAAPLPLLLIVGPYYLNKLAYIAYPGDYWVFIAIDYADRLVTLAVLWLVMRRAAPRLALPWHLRLGGPKDLVFAVVGIALLTVVDVLTDPGQRWLDGLTGQLTHYPAAPHQLNEVLDDTLGMVLVGLSEEAIFRFYLINALVLRGLTQRTAIVVSTLLFAAIHWSYGGGSVAYAAFAGLVLALVYTATRNLLAPVLAHAVVDVYFFTGVETMLKRLVW